jgi:threonine dehydrogenase-like Zn-dependent dehydrogenase
MLDLATVSHVALVGAGFMGLLTLKLLVARGIPVVVVEPRAAGREVAQAWGAQAVVTPQGAAAALPQGAPVVIEATGVAAGLALASDLTPIAGTLGIMGYHQSEGGNRTIGMESWNFRALRVLSLHHRDPGNVMRWIDRAQRMAATGVLRPSELVHDRVTLDELPQVFANPGARPPFKTVLDL